MRRETRIASARDRDRPMKMFAPDDPLERLDWKSRQKRHIARLEHLEEIDEERALRQVELFAEEVRKVLGNADHGKFRILARLTHRSIATGAWWSTSSRGSPGRSGGC